MAPRAIAKEVIGKAMQLGALTGSIDSYKLMMPDNRQIDPEQALDGASVPPGATLFLIGNTGGCAGLEVPPSAPPSFWKSAGQHHFLYAMSGLILGLIVTLTGAVLFGLGIGGKTTWAARVFGFESRISDAAPGALLFFVGVLVIWITRYDVRVAKHGVSKRLPR
jgi:hypothetical protein